MDVQDYLQILFRWIHILAGITWIGLLYFFNFVNGQFTGALDGDTKKKVIPELAPRALYWFRWGAAYTAATGLLMLGMIYYATDAASPAGGHWTTAGYLVSLIIFIAAPIYDALAKSSLAKNPKVFAAICYIAVLVIIGIFINVGDFGYRGYVMFTGAMFGIIMAFNVWMRIWPYQKKIIAGVKSGVPAEASVVALAGQRSRHNTYMSVPLVWAMINAHSTFLDGPNAWVIFAVVILVGWGAVAMTYKKAATIKGF